MNRCIQMSRISDGQKYLGVGKQELRIPQRHNPSITDKGLSPFHTGPWNSLRMDLCSNLKYCLGDGQISEWQKGFWCHSLQRITELGAREIPESVPYNTCFSLGARLFSMPLRTVHESIKFAWRYSGWLRQLAKVWSRITTRASGANVNYSYSLFVISKQHFHLVIWNGFQDLLTGVASAASWELSH